MEYRRKAKLGRLEEKSGIRERWRDNMDQRGSLGMVESKGLKDKSGIKGSREKKRAWRRSFG